MAEVFIEFDSEFAGPDATLYAARACGRERPDGLWEGWLEFAPVDGGMALRTGRETTQPNRDDLMYWAAGLTTTYVDGALGRILGPPLPKLRTREVRSRPAYEGPADAAGTPRPALNPFEVYAEDPQILRSQLMALDAWQLRIIGRAFGIAERSELELADRDELVSMILIAVERRAA